MLTSQLSSFIKQREHSSPLLLGRVILRRTMHRIADRALRSTAGVSISISCFSNGNLTHKKRVDKRRAIKDTHT